MPVISADQKATLLARNSAAKNSSNSLKSPDFSYSSDFSYYQRDKIKDSFKALNNTVKEQQVVIDTLVNAFQEHDPIL